MNALLSLAWSPNALRLAFGYPGFFHGQNVEITHVPAGDAASVRVRLTWRAGSPRVTVLRACQATAAC